MAKAETFTFSIAETGDATGEQFNWAFTAKKRLSVRDQITKDSTRRGIVGADMQNASPDTMMRAEILAHLAVSIVESPKDWRESNGGLDLYDDNILFAIYEKVIKEQASSLKQVEEEGEEAKGKLRKVARKAKDSIEAEPKD